MACRLYDGKTGLDALPYHQETGRGAEPHGTGAAWTEHHLRRLDRRLPLPSRSRNVRWMPIGLSSTPRVTNATIAGQTVSDGCVKAAWNRIASGTGLVSPRDRR